MFQPGQHTRLVSVGDDKQVCVLDLIMLWKGTCVLTYW